MTGSLTGSPSFCLFSALKSITKKINAMLVAKEMEFNYMTLACQILLGPGPVGHHTVAQACFINVL